MKRKRSLGYTAVVILLAVVAWYMNEGPAGPAAPAASTATKPVETDLPCHAYKEHRKVVNEKLTIPVLTDKKATVYKVVDVVDGDTIKVERGGKQITVRLMAMDTPEKSTTRTGSVEYFGEEAWKHAERLIRESDHEVRLTYDQTKQDQYGRDLAYVWLKDGRMLNAVMVADGYAYSYTSSPKPEYVDLFLALMRDARENQRGLWGVCS